MRAMKFVTPTRPGDIALAMDQGHQVLTVCQGCGGNLVLHRDSVGWIYCKVSGRYYHQACRPLSPCGESP